MVTQKEIEKEVLIGMTIKTDIMNIRLSKI